MTIGKLRFPLVLAVWVVFGLIGAGAAGQTSAFSYQGSLEAGGAAADGSFDLRFSVFAAETGGGTLGTVERGGVAVDAGVFSVELDFGAVVFEAGADRWLEVAVRAAGGGDYTTLTPRTRIVGVPYATRAAVAGVAEFALDGPFEPADDTPRDSSGAVGSTVSGVLTLTLPGGNQVTTVGVVLPIVMEAPLLGSPGGGGTGPARVVRLEVWRTPAADTAWYNAFLARRAAALTVTVRPAEGAGDTEFVFPGMEVTGYRVERGLDGGPVEVLSLRQIGNNPGFVRTNREPNLSLLSAPLAGGTRLPTTGTAGPMIYSWSTAPAGLHSASVLPEVRSIYDTAGNFVSFDTEPVGIVVNALAPHGMWQDFRSGVGRSISLLSGDGSVAWPKVGGPRIAFLVGWELRRAPDGGAYESYEIGIPRQ